MLGVVLSFYFIFLVVVRMSVLMRISADRPALKWYEPSGKARARWVRNAHGSVSSCIQVSGSHTHTHRLPSVPIGLYALQHINTQLSYKGVHISSLLSISILTFPYTLYLPPPAYPHTCPLIPLSHCFLPRYPELCVPCKYLQTCLTDTTLPSPLCIHTNTPLRTHWHLPMPQCHIFSTTPFLTIS